MRSVKTENLPQPATNLIAHDGAADLSRDAKSYAYFRSSAATSVNNQVFPTGRAPVLQNTVELPVLFEGKIPQ